MSKTSSGGQTATDAIGQHLNNNSGWHEVQAIATATGYSHNHVLRTATRMAEDNSTPVQRQKNQNKPVIGYSFPSGLEVPGSNRQNYIRLIRQHSNNPPGNLGSMSLSRLQTELRNVSNGQSVIENKVEFRIP